MVTTTAVTDQTSTVVVTTTVDAVLINKRAAPSRALNPPQPGSLQERDLLEQQWEKFLKEAKQVVQTFCGCIQTPKTATVSSQYPYTYIMQYSLHGMIF